MKIGDELIHTNSFEICREDFEVNYIADEAVSETLIREIQSSGMSMAEFARRSGISESSIIRYKFNRSEPSLETIVAYCITMRTNIFQSLYLTSKAGYNIFCSDDKKVYLVLFMLSHYFGINVKTANEILISLDMKPLNNMYVSQDMEDDND